MSHPVTIILDTIQTFPTTRMRLTRLLVQQESFIKLGFHLVMFFFYLYRYLLYLSSAILRFHIAYSF